MAKTESTMLPLGTEAPAFALLDVLSGQKVSMKQDSGVTATVIMFICNHCPYVKHVNPELSRIAKDYGNQPIRFIAINANDTDAYPDDAPEHMIRMAQAENFSFPYLFDETQEVAKAYQAACTPDFYVFDNTLSLVYRGQLDDSRPQNGVPLTGASIRNALDCLLSGQPVSTAQIPSLGCNIKWK